MGTEECGVCSAEMALFDGREWVKVGKGKLVITAVADTYEPNCEEASIPIRFCPVCGRRLGEE